MGCTQTNCSSSSRDPFPRGERGPCACQLQFQEHGQQSRKDDLIKLESINKKELAQKVAEIVEDIDKAICCDIINLCGSESILPEDVAKKCILGLASILF